MSFSTSTASAAAPGVHSGGGVSFATSTGSAPVPGVLSPVGIGGAAGGEQLDGAGRSNSRWNVTDQLSVRTDWESQDDLSPLLRPQSADSGLTTSSLENYSRGLRSGRCTLTTTVSPRNAVGKQLRYGVHSIQNMRREMEDAHKAVLGAEERSPTLSRPTSREGMEASLGSMSYFAIFDGHAGSRAAEFAGDRLCDLLAADRKALASQPSEALRIALERTEEEWLQMARSQDMMDGTTAAVALVDRVGGRCVVGNVGDSEIVLGTRHADGKKEVKVVTEVHHLKRSAKEVERVTSVGGRIWHGRLGHPKFSPQVLSLSVSRAIGDLFFKDDKYTEGVKSGLIAEAYIATVDICAEGTREQFLVMGCDGLWDTVTHGEAADLVFEQLKAQKDPQAITEALVRRARESGSCDNITVMVVVM